MTGIQAIDKIYMITILTKETPHIEKPQRFYPQVIGGKIVNPWIDEKDAFFPIGSHTFVSIYNFFVYKTI
jgi:hypothetical protein